MKRGISHEARLCSLGLGLLLLVVPGCPGGEQAPRVAGKRLVAPDARWRHSIVPGEGQAWAQPDYDDGSWGSGPAPLGYGESDLATETQAPTQARPPHLTVYFRHAFAVADLASIRGLSVRYQRDDGLRLLLNGTEVLRHNLPVGPIEATTRAPRAVSDDDEKGWRRVAIDLGSLRAGPNLLAAEVHQEREGSSDLRFAAELIAHRDVDPLGLLRGPYLQQTHAGGTVVRFQTDRPARTWVAWGSEPGSREHRVDEAEAAVEHEVTLELAEAGPIHYAIGIQDRVLSGGTDHIVRRPVPGNPVRAWITGDQGSADEKAFAVLEGMRRAAGNRPPGLWITLGDNAYPSGSAAEFQAAVFDTFGPLLRGTTLWPSPGNHDFAGVGPKAVAAPYFDVFSLPTAGEAGGVPSGSERYYAFDWGPLHVVSLDTVSSHRRPEAPMLDWLERDLAGARPRMPWLIAAFHHPPFSRGSHDSDEEVTTRLVQENVVPILEAHGVDLVLAGHSHNYERSAEGPGPIYVVAGHASIPGHGPLDHPKMVVSQGSVVGSLLLDADPCRLEVRAIDADGETTDQFERVKPEPCEEQ